MYERSVLVQVLSLLSVMEDSLLTLFHIIKKVCNLDPRIRTFLLDSLNAYLNKTKREPPEFF